MLVECCVPHSCRQAANLLIARSCAVEHRPCSSHSSASTLNTPRRTVGCHREEPKGRSCAIVGAHPAGPGRVGFNLIMPSRCINAHAEPPGDKEIIPTEARGEVQLNTKTWPSMHWTTTDFPDHSLHIDFTCILINTEMRDAGG